MHEAFRRIGGVEDDDALGVVGGPELEPFPDAGVERHLLGFETPLFFGEAQLRVAAAGAFQRIGGSMSSTKVLSGQRPPMATSLSERSFSMSRPRP